jgi:hypothetical protein
MAKPSSAPGLDQPLVMHAREDFGTSILPADGRKAKWTSFADEKPGSQSAFEVWLARFALV